MNIFSHFALATGLCLSFCSGAFASINLTDFERRVYSQNGEDGILEKVFEVLGILEDGYYVEFGAESGGECNTHYFRETYGWQGLLMDGHYQDETINLQREFITSENINILLDKYNTPENFDLLSIDIDFNDYYVWEAIEERFSPKVVIIEYNASHLPTEDCIVIANPSGGWDGTNYFGASLLSLFRLGTKKGYSLVNTTVGGVNAIFIRNDLISASPDLFQNINDVEALYHPARYGWGPRGGHAADSLRRNFQDSFGNLVSPPEW
jgi:hypothetical protein